jgi:hypothetical protein
MKQKISMVSNIIDDTYFYEWKNNSHYYMVFIGGAFITIQSYFEFIENLANELDINILVIPLLHQDHSTFKILDFSFEKQKKIVDKIISKHCPQGSNTIFCGIDVGASIGLYLKHEFVYYFLINPFCEWNHLIENKFFQKISQIPFLYDFIKDYLIKFLTFNIFFHVPQKFITQLTFDSTSNDNINCNNCKPGFPNTMSNIHLNEKTNNVGSIIRTQFHAVEFVSLNTFFELSMFNNIEERLKMFHKKIFIFINENTISNIRQIFELSKKVNIQHITCVNDFQQILFNLFNKKNKKSTQTKKEMKNNYKNISALPPFLTTQPQTNPLQSLLDLFQNNQNNLPFNLNFDTNNPNYNPMQNYLANFQNFSSNNSNNISRKQTNYVNNYSSQFKYPSNNLPKFNPQMINKQNSNIQYNTGTL